MARGPEAGGPGHGWRREAAILAVWAALVLAWSYAARDLLPIPPRRAWSEETQKQAPPLARYDSAWYLDIVEHGYGPPPPPGLKSSRAFFPLYPMVVRALLQVLPVNRFVAGQVVSIACFFGAGLLFAAEGRRRLGEGRSRQALIFLLLYPTAFFLMAMYSESLFLLLSLIAFREAGRNRPATAAVFGLLAGLTRPAALALALPLAIETFRVARSPDPAGGARGRAVFRAGLVGVTPAAGFLLWVFVSGWVAGEPGLFFRIQEAWNRGASPLEGLRRFAEGLPARIARGDARENPAFLLDYAHLVLFAAIGVFLARRRRFADAAWTAGALLLPIASGIPASLPRYLLVVYPAYFALAEILGDRPRLRLAWWIASGLLLAAGEAAFVHWRWVA
jgi:hypothetical protein